MTFLSKKCKPVANGGCKVTLRLFVSNLVGHLKDRFSCDVAHVSWDARKAVLRVSDQMRHKPACSVTEAG